MKTLLAATLFVLSFFNFGRDCALAQTNACVGPLNRDIYTKYTVGYLGEFYQTNASGTLTSNAVAAFGFEAAIALETNLTASAASVTIPGGEQEGMITINSNRFSYIVGTNSFSNLASAFPPGDYVFTISNNPTSSGPISVPMPDNPTFPNPPTLTNYAAAQAIDPTRDFTLYWTPFAGGSSHDYISVAVSAPSLGTVFQTAQFGCPDALDGTASSVVIPAGTLVVDQSYTADITFVQEFTVDTNSTAGVARLAGSEAETHATISTAGSVPALTLGNPALLPGGGLSFDLPTTPGVYYTIQFNPDLSNPSGWSSILTTDAVGSSLTFSNPPPAGASPGFYRAFHN
jgi:hypothetical protein